MNTHFSQDKAFYAALGKRGFNRAPVVRRYLADHETPLRVYSKLANEPYTFLFESVQGGERWARYSYIGLAANTLVEVRHQTITLKTQGHIEEQEVMDDPLIWLEAYFSRFRVYEFPNLPRFQGGLVGYFGYDTIRYIEPRLQKTGAVRTFPPNIFLMICDEMVVFDNLRGCLYLMVMSDPRSETAWKEAEQRLNALEQALFNEKPRASFDVPWEEATQVERSLLSSHSNFSQEAYLKAVEKIKRYIEQGDVMQVVLSQKISIPCRTSPLNVYRSLRFLNPSPYLFFLNLGECCLVGGSPEILVRLENQKVTIRPLAGTRPRGATSEEDANLARALKADPKECAEHLMLIDLGRNDVGRIAEIGTVRVEEQMAIEYYSHVMHMVSEVTARLRTGCSALDVIRATFPAGTVTGAPKIRAMEIIDELEPSERGVYAGAVGYMAWNGNMDLAISIRTAIIQNQTLMVQAGAGIVADSVPIREWEETLNKARALVVANEVANRLCCS